MDEHRRFLTHFKIFTFTNADFFLKFGKLKYFFKMKL